MDIVRSARAQTRDIVDDFFDGVQAMNSKEVAGKAAGEVRKALRKHSSPGPKTRAGAASLPTSTANSTGRTAKPPRALTSTPPHSKGPSTSKGTRPNNGKPTASGPSTSARKGSSAASQGLNSKAHGPLSQSPQGVPIERARWTVLKAQWDALKSNKTRMAFKAHHPDFDPNRVWPELEAMKAQEKVKDEVHDKDKPRVPACQGCGHAHPEGPCQVCARLSFRPCERELSGTEAQERARAANAEYERKLASGEIEPFKWPEPVPQKTFEDYWPIPRVLDMTPEACRRRDEMVERVLKFWREQVFKQQENGTWSKRAGFVQTTWHYRSYRQVLAEKLLSAEIEAYACAYRYQQGLEPEKFPDDETLVARVRKAAMGLLEAHRPLPERYRGTVEPEYVEYRRWLEMFDLPEGYLLHMEQDRMRASEFNEQVLLRRT